jgi:outer membrane protein assembly factor BamB
MFSPTGRLFSSHVRGRGPVVLRKLRTVALVGACVMLLAGCDWSMFGYGPAHTHANPYESKINDSNANALMTRWSVGALDGIASSPAVVNGVVYIGSDKLYAFDAVTGTTLWTAKTAGYVESSPAAVNGVVYVGSDDGNLYAFDATGSAGCSGTPKTCAPLWTAPNGGGSGSPTVVNGVVYVGADQLYAFDATGSTACSGTPKTCAPLWTAPTGEFGTSSPAVAGGVVYVKSESGNLDAFDATGTTGCTGTPKTCTPLWTAPVGQFGSSSPAVANGVVYVGSFDDDRLYAFDATGTTGCTGTPKTCAPLWTAITGGGVESSPAVANGVVYVGSDDGRLYAFDASGCGATSCGSSWTATTGDAVSSSPAVANGSVYVGSFDGRLYSFGLPKIFVDERESHVPPRIDSGASRAIDMDCLSRGGHGVATGGGFAPQDAPVTVTVSASQATPDGSPAGNSKWSETLTNRGTDTTFRATILCAKPGSATIQVVQRNAVGRAVAPGASGSSTATCQSGEVAIGGGFAAVHSGDGSIAPAVSAGQDEAAPSGTANPTAWTASVINNETVTVSFGARVMCATFSGPDPVHVVQRTESGGVALAPGATDSSTATCQPCEVATAGGFVAQRTSDASVENTVALEVSGAEIFNRIGPSAWNVVMMNNDTVAANFTATVMCVS